MSDQDKFLGFKEKVIKENEEKYGKEIREKYGDKAVDESNAKWMNMSQEQYEAFKKLEEELYQVLAAAMETNDPASDLAQKAADLHRQWLSFTWGSYSKEAHAGLAEMYVADERFKAYYDKIKPGAAQFLRDAIRIYTQNNH